MKTYTAEDFKRWGAQGGAKSKRVLTSAQAKAMVDARERKRRKTSAKLNGGTQRPLTKDDEDRRLHGGMNTPFDAPSRRAKRLAHIEHSKTIRAFHDGADTPEVRSAIERARDSALKAVRSRKSANSETEL